MRFSKKTTAIVTALAVGAVPGVAEATHTSGKAGAPGQVCKPVREARQAALRGVRGQERKALDAMLRAGYKGCIQAAARARSADRQPTPTPPVATADPPASGRAGAPGQVCKPLLRARQLALRQARRDGMNREARKALSKTFKEGYKGCIQAAAKARSQGGE